MTRIEPLVTYTYDKAARTMLMSAAIGSTHDRHSWDLGTMIVSRCFIHACNMLS